MKSLLFIFFLAVCTTGLFSQKNPVRNYKWLKDYTCYPSSGDKTGFFISNKPVTNREYLTYLFWLESVYINTPEKLCKAVPFYSVSRNHYARSFRLDSVLIVMANQDILLSGYSFNPAFLDFPVAGVSWTQAMEYSHWFTDRYNEYSMIQNKLLKTDYNQLQEESFNTEAYLAHQYEGIVIHFLKDKQGNDRLVEWSDQIFAPAFRLPLVEELSGAQNTAMTGLKEFAPTACLKPWMEAYANLFALFGNIEQTKLPAAVQVQTDEWKLNTPLKYNEGLSIDSVFSGLGMTRVDILSNIGMFSPQKTEKDSFGCMSYIIAGENANKQPIAVKRIPGYEIASRLNEDQLQSTWRFFRLVVSAVEK